MNRRLPLIAAALSMVVVAGCTTTSEGTPTPDSSSSSDSSSEQSSDDPAAGDALPSDGAPKVENPLDVSRFEENPCDVLTPEDAGTLNVSATGVERSDSLSNTCYWRNSETRGMVSASFIVGNKRGLSSTYQEAEAEDFAYFERVEDVGGQPAVAFNIDKNPPTVDCTVNVGITDQMVFSTTTELSTVNIGQKKPCQVAVDVAGMMLKTMQETA